MEYNFDVINPLGVKKDKETLNGGVAMTIDGTKNSILRVTAEFPFADL